LSRSSKRKLRKKNGSAPSGPQLKPEVPPIQNLQRAIQLQAAEQKLNKKFNRLELSTDHIYINDYGCEPFQHHQTDGWIKCKLLHGFGYSFITPDQIFFDHGGLQWIQPLAFLPSRIWRFSADEIGCHLTVDISCGHTVHIQFFNHGFVHDLQDGSQLYRCQITGPVDLQEFATGVAEWGHSDVPYLHLYHHTTADTCPKILASGSFRTSNCNIQGTTKKLNNVAYGYFTPLDEIRYDSDLKMIAMAESGEIQLMRDGFTPPKFFPPNWRQLYKSDILELQVYPCDIKKREAKLDVWVDASVLSPQHVYRHEGNGPVYYEFPHHFIHRIGTTPGQVVVFDSDRRIHQQAGLKTFDYIVVGDCSTLDGLAAPYDEEDTTHMMKVERMVGGKSILNYWFENANQDLYTGKQVEMQEFEKST